MSVALSTLIFVIGHVLLWRHLDKVPAPQGVVAPKYLAGAADVSAGWLAGVVVGIGLLALVPMGVALASSSRPLAFYVIVIAVLVAFCFSLAPLAFWLPIRAAWRRALERTEGATGR